MNNGGAKRFVARLIEEGLDVAWLRSLRDGQQPSAKAGIRRAGLRMLHFRGAITKKSRDSHGKGYWSKGPYLEDHIRLAEKLLEARP